MGTLLQPTPTGAIPLVADNWNVLKYGWNKNVSEMNTEVNIRGIVHVDSDKFFFSDGSSVILQAQLLIAVCRKFILTTTRFLLLQCALCYIFFLTISACSVSVIVLLL